jgi:hypothetical protein
MICPWPWDLRFPCPSWLPPMAMEVMANPEGKDSWNESSANSLFVISFWDVQDLSYVHVHFFVQGIQGFHAHYSCPYGHAAWRIWRARNPGMSHMSIRHLPFCFAMIIICPMSLSLTEFKMLVPCSFAACLQVSWLLRGPSPLQAQSWYAFQHSRIYDSRLPSNVMCICRNLISIMAASRLVDFDYKQGLVYNDY